MFFQFLGILINQTEVRTNDLSSSLGLIRFDEIFLWIRLLFSELRRVWERIVTDIWILHFLFDSFFLNNVYISRILSEVCPYHLRRVWAPSRHWNRDFASWLRVSKRGRVENRLKGVVKRSKFVFWNDSWQALIKFNLFHVFLSINLWPFSLLILTFFLSPDNLLFRMGFFQYLALFTGIIQILNLEIKRQFLWTLR
jgi:hypothetical protein